MRVILITMALAIALLVTACPPIGSHELRFTRHKPAEAEIIGTWRATASTTKEIQKRGHYPVAAYELVFRSDRTFSMRNMPDWWRDGFGHPHGQLDSAEGTWALEPMDNVWQIWVVRLHFLSHETWVNLYRQASPYLICVRVGDPDSDDAMFFERVPSA